MRLNLVGQSYPARSPAVSAQASINVYPAVIADPQEQGKNKGVLYGCPGKHLGATTASPPRGLWAGAGRLFLVEGTNLVERNPAYAVVTSHAYAGINDGLPAQIFSNGNQLLIIAGGLAFCDNGAGPVACRTEDFTGKVTAFGFGIGWVSGDKFLDDGSWIGRGIVIDGNPYTIGGRTTVPIQPDPTPTQIFLTTPCSSLSLTPAMTFDYSAQGEALTAVTGAVMNETFFVQRPPTVGHPAFGSQINFSAVLNGLSGDPLNPAWKGGDYVRKEGSPDNIRGILADGRQLYAMGDETMEVLQADPNAAVDGDPFIWIPGAMANYGNISSWGMCAGDGKVWFVGGDDKGGPVAYVLNGFTPVRISTEAEESAWAAAGLGRNCVSYCYTEEGHFAFCINFGAQTWVYNPELGAWHLRSKWSGAAFTPYQTNLHVFIPEWGTNGKHITACSTGPSAVYESNLNFYDDAGTDIKWRRVLPYVYNEGKRVYFGRIDLDMETGAVSGGAAPIITLDYSDDRGKTFVNPRDANEGVAGDTAHRVFWNRNGSSFGRVWGLSGIGQSKVALVDLQCDMTLGTV